MTKGKNLAELPKEIFAKQKPGKGRNEKTEKLKEIARMEAQIYRCCRLGGVHCVYTSVQCVQVGLI